METDLPARTAKSNISERGRSNIGSVPLKTWIERIRRFSGTAIGDSKKNPASCPAGSRWSDRATPPAVVVTSYPPCA
jgi:hypothetical protein